jgi:2-polyprenyl-3-methyl-5-hydroxy-6-metoxy-1,4-benzoquinol methylase
LTFEFSRCPACRLAFVVDARTDFADLYDATYYAGRGADALVDYEAELSDSRTIRRYEWRGIEQIVGCLTDVGPNTRWLDFGCGLGGLVRHVRESVGCHIVGFEEGYAGEQLAESGLPHVTRSQFEGLAGSFDVVTAIEMLEHTLDPVAELRTIHDLLTPGGVLFLTTGNAAPHSADLTRWSYAKVPDVHISFFEPTTLARALDTAGFEVHDPGSVDGFDDVIRFKVLKSLHVRRRSTWERAIPWKLVSNAVDRRHRVTEMPYGRRPR